MSTRHHHRIATVATSLAALGSLASCTAEDELGFDDFIDETELRMAMLASPDPLPQAALDTIDATLPEGQDAPATHPSLFPTGFDPNPEVVASDTDVWVTFAREGSSYDSVMGFFTYPTGSPPASLTAQELEDGVILSGTESRSNGERWHLGTFQPGVQVGFFLVRGGACSSGATCNTTVGADFTQPIVYSVDSMNPEFATDPSLSRHVIMGDLVDDLAPDARVLAWEEKERHTGFGDDDFNDLVVRVTATPALGGGTPPPVGSGGPLMGNGSVDSGEQCDDGNLADGDGCSSSGTVEPGWECGGSPSLCAFVDGLDVLQYQPGPNNTTRMHIWLGNEHGQTQQVVQSINDVPHPFGSNIQTMAGDFNGDGASDVVAIHDCGGGTACFRVNYSRADRDCTNGCLGGHATWFGAPLTDNVSAHSIFRVGDVNGDGRDDLINVQGGYPTRSHVYLADAYGHFPGSYSAFTDINVGWDPSVPYHTGDFNGDGRADLMQIGSVGGLAAFRIAYSDPSNSTSCNGNPQGCLSQGVWHGAPNTWNVGYSHNFAVGDVNGDGRDDIVQWQGGVELHPGNPRTRIHTWLAQSNGTFTTSGQGWVDTDLGWHGGTGIPHSSRIRVADFNKDGHADLWRIDDVGGQVAMRIVYANPDNSCAAAGTCFFNPNGTWHGLPTVQNIAVSARYVVGDFGAN